MAKTPSQLPELEATEITDEDRVILEDVSKPRTGAVSVGELRKRIFDGDAKLSGTMDASSGYAIYNPITQEQKIIDMTSAEELRALKPGSYAVYEVNGATNVPGGSGVGGILEVKAAQIDGIGGMFYVFTFSRVSATPSNSTVWSASCSTSTTEPLVWQVGGISAVTKLPSDNVDFKTRTVLYSGNGLFNTTIPISESWKNFDQIIILASQNQTGVTARASSVVIDVPTWIALNGNNTSYVQLIANTGGGTALSHKADVNLSANGGMTINSTAISSTPYYIRSVVGLRFLGG